MLQNSKIRNYQHYVVIPIYRKNYIVLLCFSAYLCVVALLEHVYGLSVE